MPAESAKVHGCMGVFLGFIMRGEGVGWVQRSNFLRERELSQHFLEERSKVSNV